MMLPHARRQLVRALHRDLNTTCTSTSISSSSSASTPCTLTLNFTRTLTRTHKRAIAFSTPRHTWTGRPASEHPVREKDSHNAQIDAVKAGKQDRAGSGGSGSGTEEQGGEERGASEKSGGANEKAKREFPEAPDTIGMQDDRGGKL